ncbi:MAG: T9SS type A sorting domain-containing protein [Bacteroidales bacterium]|nr:T9SS type A sorting domain-containing protein [Bacteroidales bacterium]
MKKLLLPLLISTLWISIGFAQKGVVPLNSERNSIEITDNSYDKLSLTFNHSEIRSFTVDTKEGFFDEIAIPGARFTGNVGDPKLPAYSKLIEIPFGAELSVKVKNYTVTEYKLSDFGIENAIIPAQPDVRKDEDPTLVKFHYNKDAYTSKTYTSFNIAEAEIQGVMRGIRIAKLSVSPVNYNPAAGTIKVYNNIEIEVSYTNSDINKTEYIRQATFSPFFEPVYQKLLNNKNVIDDHPDLTKYPVKMLILSDRAFETALQPYIAWKTKKGFKVIVNYTDEGYSTVNEIKAWIQAHYDAGTPEDPAPSFCLFVGDVGQIPASQVGVNSGRQTDLYYFSQDGDYFPEMYYGRFSANNLTELQPIIDKTLYHEQYEFADPAYLDDVTLIAGADGTWNPRVGQATVNYGTINYFNVSHGFTNVNDYLTSYSGCYDNERISVSFINYTAHCGQTSWGNPSLSISDINSMTNTNKYPLAVGNCCMSADFGYGECIGEAWIRAENKGAVAYIGSSPSSYWYEDFYWAVGAFPIENYNISGDTGYVPTFEETTLGVYDAMFVSDYVTVDANVFLGNLVVTEVDVQGYPQHSNPLYYWEAYNCLGDPSLVPFYTQGETNTVSHLPTLPIGMVTYEVSADPGSYVAISKDGVLHGAALVDGTGTVDVPITPVTSGGDVDIVVTKPQYIPYITTVPAAALEGPYMVVDSYVNEVDYGQSVNLDIVLENVGEDDATGVSVTVTTSDANANITNETYDYGDIAAGATSSASSGAFTLTVADDLEDQYSVAVDIAITDGNKTLWEQTKNVTVNAPELVIGNLTVDDAALGNGDGILDPGETADIIIQTTNDGHADITNVIGAITSTSTDLILNTTVTSPTVLNIGQTGDFSFNVTADGATPSGTVADIDYTVTAGVAGQYSANETKEIIIGFVPEYCEAGSNDDTDEFIERVQFVDIDNTTTIGGGYNDYTHISTDVETEGSYPITITNGDHYSSDQMGCWVDWNYDGDFEDADESFTIAYSSSIGTGTVTVPADARIGSTTMRLRVMYTGTLSPCGNASYGEVEDYTLNVLPNGVYGGTANANPTVICVSGTTTLTLSGWVGDDMQWQSSPDGSTWSDISGAVSTPYTTAIFTSDTYFRAEVTMAGYDPAYSNTALVYVNDAPVAGTAAVDVNEICEGETVILSLTGQSGDIQWQESPDGTSWVNISGAVGTPYTTSALDADTYFRAEVSNPGCDPAYSNDELVTVYDAPVGGTASADETSICTGSSTTITLTGYTGDIQWQNSPDGSVWTDISGATSAVYITDNLIVTTHFRAVLSSYLCDDTNSSTVEITVVENPVAGYSFTANNQELTFANESTNATSYSWNFGDGNSSTDVNPVHTYASSDTYTVTLTAINGVCADDVHSKDIAVTFVGISQIESNVKIVPNPNNGLFTIDFGNLNTSGTIVSIFTVSGQVICQLKTSSDILEVNLTNYAKGVYFVRITSGNEVYNDKIILK